MPKKEKKLTYQAAKNWLLVERKEEVDTTPGGLFIPQTAKEKPQEGIVIASHPGNEYKKGDRVLFGRYAGVEIKIDYAMRLLIEENEILGTLVEQ
jgi:chaperonin GroES